MINVQNISFHYKGQKTLVFDGFSLQLEENRIYGLLGKNGTGKSTLLYLLSGLLRPTKGYVSCDSLATYKRLPEMLRDIFLVTEEFDLPSMQLSEYVRLYRPFYPNFSDEILDNCLKDFELGRNVKFNELSMGQRNGLDIPSKSQFRKVIAQNMTEERTVIISTHQVHDVEQMLDHIIILDQRSVLLNASMQDIQEQYTFEYRSPQEMDESVLYAEPTLQGNAIIANRKEGDAETQVNLELLFNYKTQAK